MTIATTANPKTIPPLTRAEQTSRNPSRKAPRKRKSASVRLTQPTKPKRSVGTKAELILAKLRSPKGATIAALMEATGWQAHSVRGFLSGTLKKKHGLMVTSEKVDDIRRYRIET